MKLGHDTLEDIRIADQKGRIVLGARFAGRRFAMREQPDGTAILTPVVITPESQRPLTHQRLTESFASLEGLQNNWDGHGSLAPSPETLAYAREALALLQASALARGLPWAEPHIGCNERGQITLEWWQDSKTLTVFVRSENEMDYLRSWGADIVSDMEDGELTHISDFIALSHWLYAESAGAA